MIFWSIFRPVLAKVKEKSVLVLPGWKSTELEIGEDTPVSQMSQAGDPTPAPNIVGLASPHKSHGSFLNRFVNDDYDIM